MPMFKNSLSNLAKQSSKQNGPSVTVIELDKDNRLEFTINSIIQRKAMEDLLSPKQFVILNAYVDYKGEDFKRELFELYRRSYDKIENLIYESDFGEKMSLPFEIVHPILEKFDIEDIKNFLVNEFKIGIPSNLKEVFEDRIESDGIGTRAQTYLRSDYVYLVAFVIVIKATFMVLGQFSKATNECFNAPERDYYLLRFYRQCDKLTQSQPYEKILQYVTSLINAKATSDEEKLIRIIDKMIEEDEIVMYYLSKVIFQKLTVATIVDDTHEGNVVNTMYTFISHKIGSRGPVKTVLREKTHITDPTNREKESFTDSHLIIGDLPHGVIVTANFATSKVEYVLKQLSSEMLEIINMPIICGEKTYTLSDIEKQCKRFQYHILSDHSMKLLEIIFKGCMDPRYIYRLGLDSLLCLLPVGFAYMWNLNFKPLAMLLTSTYYDDESGFRLINSTSNKSRIPHDIIDKLRELFPLEKAGNKTNPNGELVVKKGVEEFGNSFYSIAWVSVLDHDFAKEVFGTQDGICPVKEDLKIQLATFLIEHEKYAFRKKKEK